MVLNWPLLSNSQIQVYTWEPYFSIQLTMPLKNNNCISNSIKRFFTFERFPEILYHTFVRIIYSVKMSGFLLLQNMENIS